MQRLFSVPKVGVFLDSVSFASEKRRDDTVKIAKVSLRVQPFDSKLAGAVDDGLNDNSGVRASLFKLSSPEPKPHIERLNFGLSCPRQNLEIFPAPDTDESRIVLLQTKISNVYARTQKDLDGYAFCFTASFGPNDASIWQFLAHWYLGQVFVTFTESEPSMEFSEAEDEGEEEADVRAPDHAPMFTDDAAEEPSPALAAAATNTSERKREKGHRYPDKSKGKTH